MALTHTLTAYSCSFRYYRPNGSESAIPGEVKEKIKDGEKPDYTLDAFLDDYIKYASSVQVGLNADRAIQLTKVESRKKLDDDTERTYIRPDVGKQGLEGKVVEYLTKKEHRFDKNSAAVYAHSVFFYVCGGEICVIFYRRGTSGCKSVFLETANDMLRDKYITLDMQLIAPLQPEINYSQANATEITVEWKEKPKKPRDIADELDPDSKKRKTHSKVVRALKIDLTVSDNAKIRGAVRSLLANKCTEEAAFAKIKEECGIGEEYGSASIKFNIGNRKTRSIRLGDLDNLIGAYDITDKLDINRFEPSLANAADWYYSRIREEL